MKYFVQHFSVLTLMLCLVAAPPLFAQGKVDVNKADAQGLMSLKGIGESKVKAKKEMKGAKAKKSMKGAAEKAKKSMNAASKAK